MVFYRLFLTVLAPLIVLWAFSRLLFRTESWRSIRSRLGFVPGRVPEGCESVWVHAASNGELASASSVLRVLHDTRPDLHIVVTTNTPSGRRLARSWKLERLTAEVAPFDTAWAAKRLMHRWNVRALIILEAEFWPNRIEQAAKRGAPVIVLGARLSRKTAKGWRRFSRLAQKILPHVTWLVPQDSATPRRFRRLGLNQAKIGPVVDLKALYSSAGLPRPDDTLRAAFPYADTWLAASTHNGEDSVILEAHRLARERWPELSLILAPRHPNRAGNVRKLARSMGFDVAQRSAGDDPRSDAVYIADTLGEMPLFYELASISFVGGSLIDRGGHTPFEPIAHGSAVLHGPHTGNFRRIYRELDLAGAALQVSDAASLAEVLVEMRDGSRREATNHNARRVSTSEGSPESVVAGILDKTNL